MRKKRQSLGNSFVSQAVITIKNDNSQERRLRFGRNLRIIPEDSRHGQGAKPSLNVEA